MNSIEVRITQAGDEWKVLLIADHHGDRHLLEKEFPSVEEAAADAARAVQTYPWAS